MTRLFPRHLLSRLGECNHYRSQRNGSVASAFYFGRDKKGRKRINESHHFFSSLSQPTPSLLRETNLEVPSGLAQTSNSSFEFSTILRQFDPSFKHENPKSLPFEWSKSQAVAEKEIQSFFWKGWQIAGSREKVENIGDFFTGNIGSLRFVICRDNGGNLQAFHNVCRHHAAAVAKKDGNCDFFVCPYHGWTYGLDGRLQKATRLSGIKNFSARNFGLVPISQVGIWGPFVLINNEVASRKEIDSVTSTKQKEGIIVNSQFASPKEVEKEWLRDAVGDLPFQNFCGNLVASKQWEVNCNWKVFVDIHLKNFHNIYACDFPFTSRREKAFIQFSTVGKVPGFGAVESKQNLTHAFIFPNIFLCSHGSVIIATKVLPISVEKCFLSYDFYSAEKSSHSYKEIVEFQIQAIEEELRSL